MPAQDPALAPAQVTEGMLPRKLNRGDFYVAGASWAKFHIRYPSVSFEEFWADRMRVYDLRNADTKRFFAEFQRDPEKHAKILADRTLCREIKWILDTDRPYSAPAGLREPKPEPVDEEPSTRIHVNLRCPRFQATTSRHFFDGQPKK